MQPNSIRTKIIILILVIIGFISSYTGGLFTNQILQSLNPPKQINPNPTIIPLPTPENNNIFTPASINLKPGPHYYEDGFYLQTNDNSQINLIASVGRREEGNIYVQNTRITYLNAIAPLRLIQRSNQNSPDITPDDYINKWSTQIDSSRVLKEKSEISLKLKNLNFFISTDTLNNEMTIRSLPGYTKIFSNGSATISLNGETHPANIVYYRLYSSNSNELHFYNEPLGITTDLLVFWDHYNKAYLLDSTHVSRPDSLYQSHQIAFISNPNGIVDRTFSLNISRSDNMPPSNYKINFLEPMNATINLQVQTILDKSSTNTENWYLNSVIGTVTQNGVVLSGSGFMEYIKD